jgi:hypothetical protein
VLLGGLRAREPGAVARVAAHAPGMSVMLSTAQLVVAREHGFASWAQLKTLVTAVSAGAVRYDTIGHGYSAYRRADQRIAAAVHDALGDARTVVNVGAGTGSYEPADRPVIPVEPSTAMALQRDPALPPAVLGVAESLPLADGTADAAMAVMTMHHWADVDRGLAEMARVARRRIVLHSSVSQATVLLTRRRCQASSVPGVTIRCNRRCLGSSLARAASIAWSAQSSLGARPAVAARDLMPQNEDLRVLSSVAASRQRQPAEHPDHEQVDQTDEHDRRA